MNPGDKIICRYNIRKAYDSTPRLYVDKIYTYQSEYISGLGVGKKYISVQEHSNCYYDSNSFISLKEHRKLKLNKVNESR